MAVVQQREPGFVSGWGLTVAVLVVAGAVVLGGGARTLAGPVVIDSGVIDIGYDLVDGQSDGARFGFTGPGSDTRRYGGQPLPGEPLASPRGDVGVTYDLRETDGGAVLDADVFSTLAGAEGRANGGQVVFGVTLQTVRDLRYRLTVDPAGPGALFRTGFFDVEALLSTNAAGELEGNLMVDGQPAARTFEGVLPAGVHILDVTARSLDAPGGEDGASTTGSVLLTLTADGGGGGNPIPLPPAAWAAAATLAAAGGAGWLRRRGAN